MAAMNCGAACGDRSPQHSRTACGQVGGRRRCRPSRRPRSRGRRRRCDRPRPRPRPRAWPAPAGSTSGCGCASSVSAHRLSGASTTSAPVDGVVVAALDERGRAHPRRRGRRGRARSRGRVAAAAVRATLRPSGAGDGDGDLGHLDGVGEAGAEVVVVGSDEDLALAGQAPERRGVLDAVEVALEAGAQRVGRLGERPLSAPPRLGWRPLPGCRARAAHGRLDQADRPRGRPESAHGPSPGTTIGRAPASGEAESSSVPSHALIVPAASDRLSAWRGRPSLPSHFRLCCARNVFVRRGAKPRGAR